MSTDPDRQPLNQPRQRIHAAAMKLFAEHDITKVNTSELAATTGVARGTIYSHVPEVDHLFEEVAAQQAWLWSDLGQRHEVGFLVCCNAVSALVGRMET